MQKYKKICKLVLFSREKVRNLALFGGFSGNVLESRGNAFIAINDAFGLKKQCIRLKK
jgi:hypothetical protein